MPGYSGCIRSKASTRYSMGRGFFWGTKGEQQRRNMYVANFVLIRRASYEETAYEEAGHYPEPFIIREYTEGVTVILGQDSGTVFEVHTTKAPFATNLGAKVGDSADAVLGLYRASYEEPESIHGGQLPGVFKVEKGAALIIDFHIEDGLVNPEPIAAEDRVERIILTTPVFLDDDF